MFERGSHQVTLVLELQDWIGGVYHHALLGVYRVPYWVYITMPYWVYSTMPYWVYTAVPYWVYITMPYWVYTTMPYWVSSSVSPCYSFELESLPESGTLRFGLQPARPSHSSVSTPHSVGVVDKYETMPSFFCRCWDMNSDPHGCAASPFNHCAISPAPSELSFNVLHVYLT